ncbi:hypothetical protein EZS27_009359 [termite gut metagenome]|uniref:Uncharacterized protein n=1 Tax=termite gut metagenome TaxID=433724 RepID=A0A5J4S9W7_9ZZZZ
MEATKNPESEGGIQKYIIEYLYRRIATEGFDYFKKICEEHSFLLVLDDKRGYHIKFDLEDQSDAEISKINKYAKEHTIQEIEKEIQKLRSK